MDATIQDTCMHRRTIDELSMDELDDLLLGIRSRRMERFNAYQEALAVKAQANTERLAVQMSKECAALEKEFARLDKIIESMDKRLLKIRAMKLEIEG